MLRLDRDVNQLFVFLQTLAIRFTRLRFVRYNRDDRSEFSNADLPDMEIGHDGIAVAVDCAANFFRQIRSDGSAIEKNPAGVAQENVGPGENDAASDQPNHGIEPGQAEEFARSQRNDREERGESIRQHVQIRGPQIEIGGMGMIMSILAMMIVVVMVIDL